MPARPATTTLLHCLWDTLMAERKADERRLLGPGAARDRQDRRLIEAERRANRGWANLVAWTAEADSSARSDLAAAARAELCTLRARAPRDPRAAARFDHTVRTLLVPALGSLGLDVGAADAIGAGGALGANLAA